MFNTSATFSILRQARSTIVLALLLSTSLILIACNPKQDSGQQNSLNDGLTLPLPVRFNSIDQALISDKKLSVDVRLTNNDSGGTSIYKLEGLTISATGGKYINGKITGVPTGSYTMSLEYYLLVGDTRVLVVKTDPLQTSANPQSETVIEFFESMNDYIDEDGDGRTNLHEIRKGKDWTLATDFPPPDSPFVNMAVDGMLVNLSWKNEGGADTYTVYVSENPFTIETAATFATFVNTVSAGKINGNTEYPTGYLNKNVSYYIAVKSNDNTGKGDTSTPMTINPAAFLANIESVTATGNDHKATFTWKLDSNGRANSMNLYMQNSQGVKKFSNSSTNGWMAHRNLQDSFVHGALRYDRAYFFALSARRGGPRIAGEFPDDGIENSALGTQVIIIPKDPLVGAPKNVGFHITGDAVHMMWDNDPAKSYVIYHSSRADAAVLPFKDNEPTSSDVEIFELDAPQAPYRFLDAKLQELDLSIPHYFTVVAQDGTTAQLSNESGVVGFLLQRLPNASPGASNLHPPTGVIAQVVSDKALLIKWNKVAGATSYTVYMDESPIPDDLSNFVGGGGARMVHKDEGTGVAEMSHGDLKTGTLYYIRVTAANDYGESSPSIEEKVTPLAPDKFLLSTIWAKNSVVERISSLTQPDLFDFKLIPVQGNRVPSVQLIGIYPRDSATNYTKVQEILKGTAIDLQVALPMDGGQFLTAGNGAGTAAGTDAYYLAVDPNGDRDTFQRWKEKNGIAFQADPTDPRSITYEVPDAQVLFFNGNDHELARMITVKKVGGNVAFYADHFASLQDAVINDKDKRTAKLKETVAIEFSAPEPGGNARSTERYLKFFAFNRKGERIKSINLDGRGEKFLPEACVVCHAGNARTYGAGDATVYPQQGNVSARFIPLNLDAFDFLESDPVFNRSTQELEFKFMNRAIRDAYGKDPKIVDRIYSQYVEVNTGGSTVTLNDFCDTALGTGAAGCTDQTVGVQSMSNTVAFQEGVVDDVNVNIDFLSHPDLSELQLFLVSPAGTKVELVSRGGLGGSTMGVSTDPRSPDETAKPPPPPLLTTKPAIFDDEATQTLDTGSSPYTGGWKPVNPLSAFDGEDAVGRWKLEVRDYVSGNTGIVEAWTLSVKLKAPAVELIEGWYGGVNMPNATHDGSFIPKGWNTTRSVKQFYTDNPTAVDGPRELYNKVIKESCRVCHLQRGSTGSILDFATWDNFNKDSGNLEKNQRWLNRIEHEVYVEGNMPRAFPTFKRFWMSEQPMILAKFLRPGSADPTQPAAIDGSKGAGNPFMHPSEGRSVVLDGTTSVAFGARVEHFTSVDDGSGNPLYNGTYSWSLINRPPSSDPVTAPLLDITSRNPSIIPDVAGTYVVEGTVNIDGITSNSVTDRIFVIDPSNPPSNSASFAEIYKTILKPDCRRCHRSGGPADHTGYLADREVYEVDNDGDTATAPILGIYDLVVNKDRRIHPTTTTDSRLLMKPSSKPMSRPPFATSNDTEHGGRLRPGFDINNVIATPGDRANYDLIKDWIDLRPIPTGKPPAN